MVSPLGVGVNYNWDQLTAGKSGIDLTNRVICSKRIWHFCFKADPDRHGFTGVEVVTVGVAVNGAVFELRHGGTAG